MKAREEVKISLKDSEYTEDLEKFLSYEPLIKYIKTNRIAVTRFPASGVHLRIGKCDYWPATDRFYNRRTHKKGNGEEALLIAIRSQYPRYAQCLVPAW